MARVAFVQHLAVEHLGLGYISAVLKQHGHSVEMFIESDKGDVVADVLAYKPDIAGFSCTTGFHNLSLKVAREVNHPVYKTGHLKIILAVQESSLAHDDT